MINNIQEFDIHYDLAMPAGALRKNANAAAVARVVTGKGAVKRQVLSVPVCSSAGAPRS